MTAQGLRNSSDDVVLRVSQHYFWGMCVVFQNGISCHTLAWQLPFGPSDFSFPLINLQRPLADEGTDKDKVQTKVSAGQKSNLFNKVQLINHSCWSLRGFFWLCSGFCKSLQIRRHLLKLHAQQSGCGFNACKRGARLIVRGRTHGDLSQN